MSADFVLHTNPRSRGGIARWMLEETGAPYRAINYEYGAPMKTPEFLALNALGKVPVLEHGDVVVSECAAICAYLADVCPEAGLAPPPAERGAYYRWLFFVAGPLESAVIDHSLNKEPVGDLRARSNYGEYARVMDALENAVKDREFIAGDRFSAADVYVAAHLGWGLMFNTVEKRPGFEEYVARHAARPAYKRAEELDNAAAAA